MRNHYSYIKNKMLKLKKNSVTLWGKNVKKLVSTKMKVATRKNRCKQNMVRKRSSDGNINMMRNLLKIIKKVLNKNSVTLRIDD